MSSKSLPIATSLTHRSLPPLLQQRLMGGWDLEFEDEDELQQRRMMNVTVLHKDIVTPYR